jgi:hypothetical protein
MQWECLPINSNKLIPNPHCQKPATVDLEALSTNYCRMIIKQCVTKVRSTKYSLQIYEFQVIVTLDEKSIFNRFFYSILFGLHTTKSNYGIVDTN